MESVVTAIAMGINPALANVVLVLLCAGFAHVYVMLVRMQADIRYMREKLIGIEEEKRLAEWSLPRYSVAVAKNPSQRR